MEFYKNQNVEIIKDNNKIKIIAKQNKSTPGAYFRIHIDDNETYKIIIKAVKKSRGTVKLWIAYNDNSCIEFSEKYKIENHVTNIEYNLSNNTGKRQLYKIGLLFNNCRNGDSIIIHKYKIERIPGSKYLYLYHYREGNGHYNAIWQNYVKEYARGKIDCIDITNANKELLKKYEVVIIDFYVLARYNPLKGRDKYLSMLEENKKIGIYLHDMHEYTFIDDRELRKKALIDNQPSEIPGKGVKSFIKFLKTNNINYLISRCDCKEFENILLEGKDIINKHYYLPHHINPKQFRDYKLNKEYDIIIYGATSKSTYPFRARLKNILLKSNFRIKYIPKKNAIYGEELSKLLNKSWIGIATKSNFDYLVCKYFEISASRCVVAGDMPIQGKKIWKNEYIDLNNDMSDKEIIDKLKFYLDNKDKLIKMMDEMHRIISDTYTYIKFTDKLKLICKDIDN
jgi:hypothetical protein